MTISRSLLTPSKYPPESNPNCVAICSWVEVLSDPDVIRVGGIELDDKEKRVMLDGELVALTPTEYEILKLLIQNPGQVFSPKEIYTRIWNDLPLGSENTVAVHIRHLREKLEINPAEPRYLKVVWGQGYKCEKQG